MSKAKITRSKINFTKAKIESLPLPEKGWTYHYDFKVQGLGIGIGSTGKKTFILYRKISARTVEPRGEHGRQLDAVLFTFPDDPVATLERDFERLLERIRGVNEHVVALFDGALVLDSHVDGEVVAAERGHRVLRIVHKGVGRLGSWRRRL